MIAALGVGIGEDFDASKLRYHKVILMTDADVDGSHIQTLLLTFFFRHMPELIGRGNLYLAQPPLYKLKRGKSEQYVQTDADLSQHLLGIGLSEAQVFAAGHDSALLEPTLRQLLADAQRCERVAGAMERRSIDSRLVEAAAASGLSATEPFNDEASRSAFEQRLSAYLERAYPETLPVQVSWSHDEEHSRFVPTVRMTQAVVQRVLELDQALVESPDYQRFVALAAHTRDVGAGPYRLVTTGDTREIATPRALLTALLALASKGQYIQRYKGLGEMNAEQLWETTMDPTRRVLLQVHVEDKPEAEQTFSILMGDLVEPRKDFIEKNALNVVNLDI
jgi:DNA gyrase subunit B